MHRKTPNPASLSAIKSPILSLRETWIGVLALLLLTFLVYIPTYQAGFIWDDDVIAANPLLREGWRGLRDIWITTRFGDFVPMTATTFWIEWQIHGAMKEIQHATNVVLQAFNAVLLWRVLLRLRVPGSWIIAALFAMHPVCAASVTWLAERKNTLSMFFYLLSVLFYLRSETVPVRDSSPTKVSVSLYWLSFAFFLFGLLSKSSVVVLPVVLLLIAWWQHGKIGRTTVIRVAPFFGFAFAVGIATLVAHHYLAPKIGVLPSEESLLVRTLTAGRAFWFYLGKDLLPAGLTMHYPRWNVSAVSPVSYLPALSIVALFFFFWKNRSHTWGRACLFGLGYFVLALGPTIGVINMAFLSMAPVADHFQYMALPGIIALVVLATLYGVQRILPKPQLRLLPVIVFGLLAPPLAALSWAHQSRMANPEALWRDNLAKNPTSWAANNNLAGILFERGKYEESLSLYREALKGRDNLSMVHVNVGRALFALGKTDEAIGHYFNALKVDSTDFKAHNNLGVALITLGRTNEAIAAFQSAVQLAPTDHTFFANLGRLLVESGQTTKAIELYRQRVQRFPSDSVAHTQLGQLLFTSGNLNDALVHYKTAVSLSPQSIDARFGLAEIEAQLNNKAAAIEQWRQILILQPDAVPVMANLAWALATDHNGTLRNGRDAVVLAERACAIGGRNNARFLDLLAAAYAEAGRFPEAIKTAEEGVSLAQARDEEALVSQLRSRLNLYQSGLAFRSH